MTGKKNSLLYLLSLVLVGVFAIGFVTAMGFLNYRSTAIALEEKVIARVETDNVDRMENAISFGKSFENFYGIEDVFAAFQEQFPGPQPFVITKQGELLYCAEGDEALGAQRVRDYLASEEFSREIPHLEEKLGEVVSAGRLRAVFQAIRQDEDLVGYFGALYTASLFDRSFANLSPVIFQQVIGFSLLLCVSMAIYVAIVQNKAWQQTHRRKSDRQMETAASVGILAVIILLLTAVSIYSYQKDYRDKVEDSARIPLMSLENSLSQVQDQGIDLREVEGLREYIRDHVSTLDTLHAIRVSERISEVKRTAEESNLLAFHFNTGTSESETLYLEAEVSDEAIGREMKGIVLVLLSTMIILMIFVFEMNNLVKLSNVGMSAQWKEHSLNEGQVSLALRFTGFLCSTAECMCVPYAAMMIRASGESLFGLSIGMTSALPLTLEGFAQMIGMLLLPRVTKRFNVKKVLIVSTVLMIACNVSAFWFGGALTIVLCRAIAGLAYSGFKQVSNFLITRGYESEKGRSDNISQDNAGLLAGATCGAGLGAILSANAGYAITFLCSAVLFGFYLIFTFTLVPWSALERRAAQEEEKPIQMKGILTMLLSPEMLFFILAVSIPLNIGVMLCVTLVPAICQIHGISSVMLSYCYIANGLAGIYIGPALVSKAKSCFGLRPCIAFALGLTAIGIFILRLPPVLLMLVLTSMILGFLDGFGTPMVTDQFMSLRVVAREVDESTSLIFYVVLSYVMLTFAPMIAELMLLPGNGPFSPLLIGAALYAAAAVLVLLMRTRKGEEARELSAR